jgi:hypothetical protein
VIGKEIRALLPAWLACAAVIVAGVIGFSPFRGFEVAAYFIGTGVLGALSIGHEYSDRTLGLLLSQPIDRRRVLLTKMGVLAVMLAALMGITVATMRFDPNDKRLIGAAILWLPLLVSLFVAPWLTMVSRMAVGGAVFSVALVGILLLIGQWLGVVRHGYTYDADAFQIAFLWWALAGLSVVGAVMTWRTFLRLEITDGTGASASVRIRAMESGSAPAGVRRRNPVWLLVRKELRLQLLALAIAGVYVIAYVVAWRLTPSSDSDALTVITVFYSGLLAMLVGALASAEERQLGTSEWQMLLPMARSRQWAVKAGTVLVLAVLLGIGLPWLLVSVFPPEHLMLFQRSRPFVQPKTFALILTVAAGSLYISSLSSGGLWALLASLPAFVGVALFVQTVGATVERAVYANIGYPDGHRIAVGFTTDRWMGILLAGLIALTLGLALRNHRSAERGAARAVPQVALIATCATAGFALVLVLGAFLR